MNFDQAFDELMESEGGWSDDARDPGNWTSGVVGKGDLLGTKFGIAANTYSDIDIKNLTRDQAKAIYKRDFWDVWLNMEGMTAELPDALLYELFDAGVNTGKGNARRFLQRTLGVAEDGKIGQVTIDALDTQLRELGVARVEMRYIAEVLDHCANLKTWGTYGRGWTKRRIRSLRNI